MRLKKNIVKLPLINALQEYQNWSYLVKANYILYVWQTKITNSKETSSDKTITKKEE
jgi:hypothetical protein